jgi:hypothetical protein
MQNGLTRTAAHFRHRKEVNFPFSCKSSARIDLQCILKASYTRQNVVLIATIKQIRYPEKPLSKISPGTKRLQE